MFAVRELGSDMRTGVVWGQDFAPRVVAKRRIAAVANMSEGLAKTVRVAGWPAADRTT